MLAEKFCLLLESLREHDSEMRVRSTSPHIPVVLPANPRLPTTEKRAA